MLLSCCFIVRATTSIVDSYLRGGGDAGRVIKRRVEREDDAPVIYSNQESAPSASSSPPPPSVLFLFSLLLLLLLPLHTRGIPMFAREVTDESALENRYRVRRANFTLRESRERVDPTRVDSTGYQKRPRPALIVVTSSLSPVRYSDFHSESAPSLSAELYDMHM